MKKAIDDLPGWKAQREVKFSYDGPINDNIYRSDRPDRSALMLVKGSVDFVVQKGSKKYAVEIKVETDNKHETKRFAGKTAVEAFKSDIMKLQKERLRQGQRTQYDEKWSIIVARSASQRQQFKSMIQDLNDDQDIALKYWTIVDCNGYLAVLHRQQGRGLNMEQTIRNNNLGAVSIAMNAVYNRGFQELSYECTVKYAFDNANPEFSFLYIIGHNHADFKRELPAGKRSVDEQQWEKHAQVLIAKSLQCHTFGFSAYSKKIREIRGGFTNPKQSVDFNFFTVPSNDEYAIELKVEIHPQNLSDDDDDDSNKKQEKHLVRKALESDVKKMKNWKKQDNNQRKWAVAIMDATSNNCRAVNAWGGQTESRDCPATWTTPTLAYTINLSGGSKAMVWTYIVGENVLITLACLVRPNDDPKVCTDPNLPKQAAQQPPRKVPKRF